MDVPTRLRQDNGPAVLKDAGGRLDEHDGLSRHRAVQLPRVLHVVAPDREHRLDGQRRPVDQACANHLAFPSGTPTELRCISCPHGCRAPVHKPGLSPQRNEGHEGLRRLTAEDVEESPDRGTKHSSTYSLQPTASGLQRPLCPLWFLLALPEKDDSGVPPARCNDDHRQAEHGVDAHDPPNPSKVLPAL